MIDYEKARSKANTFRLLTGLTIEEFDLLLVSFQAAYDETTQPGDHKPRSTAGRKSALGDCAGKLFFILFYFRQYPTQHTIAFLFGFSQPQANVWIHRLAPLLNKALGREQALPMRDATTMKQLLEACPELELVIDGTERPIRRPQDESDRRNDYSGKKKRHTKKNIVITDQDSGRIVGLGKTQPGSMHDKTCAEEDGYSFPEGTPLFQDTGFQGYAPEGATIHQPTKKPRGKELTPEQKAENRKISSDRVGVEHSIGKVKIFRIVADVYRNFKVGFVDSVMETACGLFNFTRSCRLAM